MQLLTVCLGLIGNTPGLLIGEALALAMTSYSSLSGSHFSSTFRFRLHSSLVKSLGFSRRILLFIPLLCCHVLNIGEKKCPIAETRSTLGADNS